MKPLLASSVALAFLSCVCGSWLDGNVGVDRYGGNLPDQNFTMNMTAQPKDCALLCRANVKCLAWVYAKPDCGAATHPLCLQKAVSNNSQSRNPCVVSGLGYEPKLVPQKFLPFPVGSLQPRGWLRDVLDTQVNGLSGHLPDFWGPVSNSIWLGGTDDTGLHEDTPYWLNGFLPLAYQLGNKENISMVEKYVAYILDNQSASGWLGPDDNQQDGNHYWGVFNIINVLRMYHEANPDETWAVPAILRFFQEMYRRMFDVPMNAGGTQTWSAARWADLALNVYWMLENHPSEQEQMLWDFAELLHDQGFDWDGFYGSNGGLEFPTGPVSHVDLYSHGVNNAMAIKYNAIWSRQVEPEEYDRNETYMAMTMLDKYHGQANGIHGCDEHLAGSNPSRGAELCTVVEAMFSYEVMFNIIGDPYFSERAERLAYNALPATLTPDMWAHQYLQQVNQVKSMRLDDHIWTNDGPDATVFGLAPNFVCCTANFNQGWPKFTQHVMSMLPEGDGVAVSMYAPATLTHTLPSGVRTTVTVTTNYPFEGSVAITADCGRGMRLSLRIPGWTSGPSVTVDGVMDPYGVPEPGSMYTVNCTSFTNVSLSFPMAVMVERRYNDAASVYYGALLFALSVKDDDFVVATYRLGAKDYSMYPAQQWKYALYLPDNNHPEKYFNVTYMGMKSGVTPFSLQNSPLKMYTQGVQIEWKVLHNAPDAPPQSPALVNASSSLEPLLYYPYGATNLRIGEIPVLTSV